MSGHPEQPVSFAEFAGLAGYKRSYITQLKTAGRLVLSEDGKRVLPQASQARIAATRDPSKAAVAARHAEQRAAMEPDDGEALEPPLPAQPSPVHGEYQNHRAHREKFLALAAQREHEVAMGSLLDAAEVEAVIAASVTTLRTRLETLPDLLAPQLAAELDEMRCRSLIAEAIEQQLGELARGFRQLVKAEAPR